MRASTVLEAATEMVTGDRDRQNGAKIPNHENIAELWNAYLENKQRTHEAGWNITAKDVALMMVLFKVARTQLGTHNMDDYKDMAGYAACAGEIADVEAF